MKKLFVILALLLLAVVLSAGCIQEPESPPPHQPPVLPETPDAPPPPTFKSVDEYLSLLNEYYSLGLTEAEIQNYAEELDTGYLKDARRGEGGIWVDDVVGFQTEVTRMLNLDPEIHDELVSQLQNPWADEPDIVLPNEGQENTDTSTGETVEVTPLPEVPSKPMLPTTLISSVEEHVAELAEQNKISVTDSQISAVADELKNGYLKHTVHNGLSYEVTDYMEFKEETLRILQTL